MHIDDFDYSLPPSAIAQEPPPDRGSSRLLVLDRGSGARRHERFASLPGLLRPGDLLVLNRSRVFRARLLGRRPDGGAAEALLVAPLGEARWQALLRPGRRLRPGAVIHVSDDLQVEVEAGAAGSDGRRPVRLVTRGALTPEQAIERDGHVPLPPYIRRPDTNADRERYQTVYAREAGSVAAPTAGLHFTVDLLTRLTQRGVNRADLLLHVGPGTFRPVQVEDVSQHQVEEEPYWIPDETAAAIDAARAAQGRVVAVGTTVTRALESAAQPGGRVGPGEGRTSLVVTPGYDFKVVDALVTNFHLPRSSLLLLVAAFAGRERVIEAYAEAVRAGYRFYSYGDAMLIA